MADENVTDCRIEYDDGPNEYCDTHDVLRDLDETRCDTARMLAAEATIQRVRELHYNTATHHPSGCCSECGGTYPCPTVRALDGGAE